MDHWGERLQQALRRRRIRKLHALAVEIGVDQSAISRWRKGQPISLPNAISRCRALDISLDWLVTGRGAMEAHRLAVPGSFDVAVDALFGKLTANEAAAVRHTLAALSEAAGRRAGLAET
ncbi:MAG: helix-turn-helix transcriptional regulator [Xanthobacteraceae bacterium]